MWQRYARVRAMQALCVIEAGDTGLLERLKEFVADQYDDADAVPRDVLDKVSELTAALTRGAWAARERYDELLRQRVSNWSLTRVGSVERGILRVALEELLGESMKDKRPPAKVAINEAIEIARTFGSAESAAFVNGVLDAVYQEEMSADRAAQTS